MKTPLTYGFISALAGALITLLLYFAGFHDSPEKLTAAQVIGGVVGLTAVVTCLALAMRDKRAAATNEWGYGSALGVGTLTGLVNIVLSSIFYFIYASFINPGFTDVIYQAQVAKMEAKGMSATQIANAEPIMRKMMSPAVSCVMQFIGGFIFCFILALIVAIFFRKPREAAPGDTTPPPVG